MAYIQTKDGIEIYYECYGEGEPVVFIHGLGASSAMYQPQVEYFRKFYRVILIDLRGNGSSGKLECSPEQVLERQIEDIREVLNTLHIENAVFVGVSYGGVLIQKLAIMHPGMVKALVIADSFCDTSVDSLQKRLAMIGARQTWILHLPPKWLAALTKSSYKKWPLAYKEMESVMLRMRKEETKLQRQAINDIHFNEQLAATSVPALCIVGDHTKLGVHMMRQVSRYLQHSKLVVIENSFDPSNLCQPHVFNVKMHKFLKEQGEGAKLNLMQNT